MFTYRKLQSNAGFILQKIQKIGTGKNVKRLFSRKTFLKLIGGFVAAVDLSAGTSLLISSKMGVGKYYWQINPDLCIQCDRCRTNCVLTPSAVKCIHSYAICGYCDLCSGYLKQNHIERGSAAENQLCPTGAVKRISSNDGYLLKDSI